MIKQITKLAKSYWEWDIKPFFKAFFPENKVEIRDEEEPLGYIEDHIDEEWDVEDDDDNVPKPPFVQEEKGFI